MTVVEMIDEIIRVVSKKEEKFEGILDTASLKDLNNHYDRMSSSVSESKVPDLWGDVWEEAMGDQYLEVMKLYPSINVVGRDGDVYYNVVNRGQEAVLVQLPIVIVEKKPDSSFDSYSVHTGEIKI